MLLSRLKEQGLVPNTNTYTTLVDEHCKAGNFLKVQEAYKALKIWFRSGLKVDKVTYTILISAHCKQAEFKQVLVLFNKMVKSGIQPDIHSYTTLIAVFCRGKKNERK
ncbi:hypothetical protein VNO78_15093 [Psophocarpus tetragonolobus]|uniref:Pentatricopeptide repeat-containing protein n=1 Tax=Psophocarpus tetragonolobus TaxID=3891 RepID=A0AAN9SJ25_PSOTE